MIERRRENENVERPRFQFRIVSDLPGALIVDVENDVFAAFETVENLGLRSPVPLLMNECTFDKFRSRNHGFKHFRPDEVITDAVDLARARPAGGVRDRKIERDADRLGVLAGAVCEGRLSRPPWGRDGGKRPIGGGGTRPFWPARVSARP